MGWKDWDYKGWKAGIGVERLGDWDRGGKTGIGMERLG